MDQKNDHTSQCHWYFRFKALAFILTSGAVTYAHLFLPYMELKIIQRASHHIRA